MEVITQRGVIKTVVSRWEAQYARYPASDEKIEILIRLKELNLDICTPMEIAAIIGNESWTRLACDDCGTEVEAVVQVGQEPDYESSTASLCLKCVTKAKKLLKEAV